jgi:uncharacterized protein YbaP (TraB family)/HEAT repeat protein
MKIRLLGLLMAFSTLIGAQVSNSILWKISGNGLPSPSYLLGTIHIKDKRVFNFPDSVLSSISKCNFFVMELDPDSLTSLLFRENDSDSSSFRSVFSKEEYEKVNDKLQKDAGVTLDQLKGRDLKFLRLLMSHGKSKNDDMPTFMDAYLYNIARRLGKTTLGLESVQSQKTVMNTVMNNEETATRENLVKMSEPSSKKDDLLETMIEEYLHGNLDEMAHAFDVMDEESQDVLLYNRNITMAKKIDSLIKVDTRFVAVGAGHLPGEKGLIALLKKRGYSVVPVSMVNSGLSKKFNVDDKQQKWQEASFPDQGYAFSTPGKPELYKKLSTIFDLYMYYDVGTGSVYSAYGITMLEDNSRDEDKLLDKFYDRLKENKLFSHLSQRRFTLNGCKAMDVESQNPQNYHSKIRFIVRGNTIYALTVAYPKNNLFPGDADRFLESFHTIEIKNKDWKHLDNQAGAFEADMPGTPRENIIPRSGTTSTISKINQFMSTDNKTGIQYLIQYFDLWEGYYYPNDSALFAKQLARMIEKDNVARSESSPIKLRGMPGQDLLIVYKENTEIRARSFIRGTRNYTIMAVVSSSNSNKQDAATFFNSFRIKEYRYNPLSDQSFPSLGMKMKVPSALKLYENDSSLQFSDIGVKTLISYDQVTGTTYFISRHQMSPYKYAKNDSAYYEFHIKSFQIDDDTVIYKKKIISGGIKGIELVYRNKNTHCLKRERVYLKGDAVYSIYAHLPQSDAWNQFNDSIFTSISFTDSLQNRSIFIRHTDQLLNDLASSDTTTQKTAKKFFYDYDFNREDLPLIYKALKKPFPDDTVLFSGTRESLLRKLPMLQTDSMVTFLKEFLSDRKTPPALRYAAIHTLGELKTNSSYSVIKGFLKSDPSLLTESKMLMYSLADSLALTRNVLFPDLLDLVNDTSYNTGLLSLTYQLLDSGLIHFSDINPYKDRINKSGLHDVKIYIEQKKEGLESWVDDNAIKILSFFPSHEGDELALSMLSSKDPDAMQAAVKYQIQKNIPVSKKDMNKIAENLKTRISLYGFLKSVKRLDLFPAKYASRGDLAESKLYAALSEDDEFRGKLIYQGVHTVESNGVSYTLGVFKIIIKNDGKEFIFAGFTGPYTDSEETNEPGMLTGSIYQEYGSASIEELCKEYIKKMGL